MQDAPRGGARSPHGSSLSPSPSPSPSPLSRSASPESPRALSPSARGTGRSFPSPGPQTASTAQTITLPRDPPPIPSSPGSLYSAYSYYQLDTPQQSPTGATLQVPGSPRATPQLSQPPRRAPDDGMTADSYLQLGIQHHEANRLTESAAAFEQSAKMDGGSGVGMLMWGLTLRHGWGTEKNEKLAFSWLRRAAEAAVGDLEKARMGVDTSAVKGELVLAIYEVGQCFFQGWGVKKDQKMAVSYFQVAAKLGDADAQTELAFCLANGRGCKKDRKEAAKWYRAAVAQGVSDVGLAWIYKEKFQ
ncbi:HCP-like protein [Artomyces pyxidatus]|uniref:HCP-like protein n=1 Tax=Artomyces pyxidatus TaxID=48021 RepID=A0ACB8SXM7_9AGAM|nr:HCP-like protein [Artomyces pyxidatus]